MYQTWDQTGKGGQVEGVCWHQWGRWDVKSGQYIIQGGLLVASRGIGKEIIETWQERQCEKCGKSQRELIYIGKGM